MKSRKDLLLLSLLSILIAFTAPAQTTSSKSQKPLVVFVTGDHEYSSEGTMPLIAAELEKNYGFRAIVLKSSPDHKSEENIPGLEALKQADLAVFFLRWRRLPEEQVKYIEEYLNSGKPVMGFRTSTHAFNYPTGHPLEKWNAFGEIALGSPPGWGKKGHTHYGHNSSTNVFVFPKNSKHPILTGVTSKFHVPSWLYHVLPEYPAKGSTWLLMGKSVNPDKPAIENPVAWTWKNASGARVFTTTLGHPHDFKEEGVQRLTINAIHWTLGKPVPKKWAGKFNIDVPYHGL